MERAIPAGAVVLAMDDCGRVYVHGDLLVIERTHNHAVILRAVLPVDLEWLAGWLALFEAGCDALAERIDHAAS